MQRMMGFVVAIAVVLSGCSDSSVEYVAASGQRGSGSLLKVNGKSGEMRIISMSGSVERTIPLVDVDFNDPLQSAASNHALLNATMADTKQKLSFVKLGGAIVCLPCGDLGLPINWLMKRKEK